MRCPIHDCEMEYVAAGDDLGYYERAEWYCERCHEEEEWEYDHCSECGELNGDCACDTGYYEYHPEWNEAE